MIIRITTYVIEFFLREHYVNYLLYKIILNYIKIEFWQINHKITSFLQNMIVLFIYRGW